MNEIEELKNSLSLSTKEFAELFDIPYNTVRQWLNGERNCPKYVISMFKKLIEYQKNVSQPSIDGEIYYGLKLTLPTGTTYCRLFKNKSDFQQDLKFEKNIQDLTRKSIVELTLIEVQDLRIEHRFYPKTKQKGLPTIV